MLEEDDDDDQMSETVIDRFKRAAKPQAHQRNIINVHSCLSFEILVTFVFQVKLLLNNSTGNYRQ
jgi:hypothetical protein